MAGKFRPVVLVATDYFVPGEKAGGPVQTLVNMVSRLGGNWHFKIATRDRDIRDTEPYDRVPLEKWTPVKGADVIYLPPQSRASRLLELARNTPFDILYLNSFLSPAFTVPLLLARRCGLIAKKPLIVVPHGELSAGALRIKRLKKRVYIFTVKALGLCKDAIWQASTEFEAADIRRIFGNEARVVIAQDCLPDEADVPPLAAREKKPGQLDIVYLARISKIKNLDSSIRMLAKLRGSVRLHIYGPMEDEAYWKTCEAAIRELPANIAVEYCGTVPHSAVFGVMSRHHLFFLLTQGENFGFAIFEALLAGCPLLISDRTPWRSLQEMGCGWDLPLDEEKRFCDALQACVDMEGEAFAKMSQSARQFGLETLRNDPSAEQSDRLFRTALAAGR
jgi:glycosyltransferase involved in cell wall biosynthesis